MKKVWFITGTSSGFGKELTKELLEQGYSVVATARKIEKAEEAIAGNENGLALSLDVNDEKQVDAAVQATLERFGRIDVLVNNAGYGYFGAVEESDVADVRQMFETNFWGVSNITRAFLPQFRKQREGHILNITSIGGLDGSPGFGYYNATKFGVEGFAAALAKELEPLGIKVTNVEPGPFRTEWAGGSSVETKVEIDDYKTTARANIERTHGFSGEQTGSPELAAKAMIKAVESENAPLHFLMGQNAFKRAHAKVEKVLSDLADWEEVSNHVDYGDEDFWK